MYPEIVFTARWLLLQQFRASRRQPHFWAGLLQPSEICPQTTSRLDSINISTTRQPSHRARQEDGESSFLISSFPYLAFLIPSPFSYHRLPRIFALLSLLALLALPIITYPISPSSPYPKSLGHTRAIADQVPGLYQVGQEQRLLQVRGFKVLCYHLTHTVASKPSTSVAGLGRLITMLGNA